MKKLNYENLYRKVTKFLYIKPIISDVEIEKFIKNCKPQSNAAEDILYDILDNGYFMRSENKYYAMPFS